MSARGTVYNDSTPRALTSAESDEFVRRVQVARDRKIKGRADNVQAALFRQAIQHWVNYDSQEKSRESGKDSKNPATGRPYQNGARIARESGGGVPRDYRAGIAR